MVCLILLVSSETEKKGDNNDHVILIETAMALNESFYAVSKY